MLDIKLIREKPDFIREKLKLRGEDDTIILRMLDIDKKRREIIKEDESLKELRNKVSDQIAVMKKNKENADEKISEMKQVSSEIKKLDEELRKLDAMIDGELMFIPNNPNDNVPIGKSEADNVEVKVFDEKKEFDFKVLDHLELGKKLDIIDFDIGAKIAGSGFPFYKGKGATLERALWNFMLDTHIKNGYIEVLPPILVSSASMEAAEKIPKFADDMYHIERDDLYAIPTAEVPLVNIHRDEILRFEGLPIKYCSFTNCFRREAGSYGKETKGFLRVHQFNKVELVSFCIPESSYDELEAMLLDACKILDKLNIHYRIIELCTGDLGFSASKCYDIEVWSYAENKWLEASSVSNFTDFQSRRGKIRYKKILKEGKTKTEFVHILNGSGLATSRLIVSLLETYQNKDGHIVVPEVLRKYTGFDII
ncbi:serine--tRNA ligase [Bacteroidota bacterium]